MSSSERTGNKYRISPELFSRDLEREREFGISDLRIYGYEAEAGMMRIAGEVSMVETSIKSMVPTVA